LRGRIGLTLANSTAAVHLIDSKAANATSPSKLKHGCPSKEATFIDGYRHDESRKRPIWTEKQQAIFQIPLRESNSSGRKKGLSDSLTVIASVLLLRYKLIRTTLDNRVSGVAAIAANSSEEPQHRVDPSRATPSPRRMHGAASCADALQPVPGLLVGHQHDLCGVLAIARASRRVLALRQRWGFQRWRVAPRLDLDD
jgi:hypothetical protein